MKNLKTNLRIVTAVLFLSFLTATSAVAQSGRGYDMPTFEEFDLNSDGVITKDELEKARELRALQRSKEGRRLQGKRFNYDFSEIDLNSDGVITKEEFKAHQGI